MDKIWERNLSKSEVNGRCGRDEQNKWPRRTDKSQTLKEFILNVKEKRRLPEIVKSISDREGLSNIHSSIIYFKLVSTLLCLHQELITC